ncbi:hypothetical protein BRADI_4g06166v3 [Brachypodium distachyon]|uniref:Uncharacterized protein n=1 Tax=Brachypodium distachyon TaxID=15368 RepID=A0A0Q3L230_BRADI|nr:hypothetical protein BRADI_4g06166v3 [Brachypodium distachyon]
MLHSLLQRLHINPAVARTTVLHTRALLEATLLASHLLLGTDSGFYWCNGWWMLKVPESASCRV